MSVEQERNPIALGYSPVSSVLKAASPRVKSPHAPTRSTATKPATLKLQKNYCFACGQNNPDGMRLKFTLDEERQTFVCRFRLGKRYTGPPGHCHGGIIATILDDAMGKVNKLRHVIALTKEMTVEYLKPVPLHQAAARRGQGSQRSRPPAHQHGRNHERKGRSPGTQQRTFIAIDPEKMFGKFVER